MSNFKSLPADAGEDESKGRRRILPKVLHDLEGVGVPDLVGKVGHVVLVIAVVVDVALLFDGKVGVRRDDLEGGAAVAEDVLLGGDGAVVLGRVGAEELEQENALCVSMNRIGICSTETRFEDWLDSNQAKLQFEYFL